MRTPARHATWLDAHDAALAPGQDLARARRAIEAADIDQQAELHRTFILDFVADHSDALHRHCMLGHLTGSALVVDPAGERVVMLHHRKLRRWLQPGGHCDGDSNLAAVALREATEETGLGGLLVHPVAIDLDVHEVDPPADGPHLHLDVRYLVLAPDPRDPPGNDESTAIRWVRVEEVDALGIDAGTRRMIDHGLAVFDAVS